MADDVITLLKDTGKHAKGSVVRVWQSGPVERGMVDAQRAAQWIKDGIAKAGRSVVKAAAPRKGK